MKKDTHPKYYPQAKIVCACGNVMEVGSTMEEIHVEICSACHPFFTGKQKLIDTARRVDKFQKRLAKKTELGTRKGKKAKRAAKATTNKAAKEKKDKKSDK